MATISEKDFVLEGRPLQQVRGFLNYYFAFAGNFHAVVNQILKSKNKFLYTNIFRYLIEKNTIFLNFPRVNNTTQFVNFASDATETQLAASEMGKQSNRLVVKENNNILVNELKAALLSLQLAKQKAPEVGPLFGSRLYIDNNAVVALINRGRVKWSEDTISIFSKFNFLKKSELFKEQFPVRAVYIPTAGNPADALSRMLTRSASGLFRCMV